VNAVINLFVGGTDFAFYVNKNGWRSRKEFMVHWEGSPTGFGELSYRFIDI
jgi:hypothetical protein